MCVPFPPKGSLELRFRRNKNEKDLLYIYICVCAVHFTVGLWEMVFPFVAHFSYFVCLPLRARRNGLFFHSEGVGDAI